MRNLGQDVVVVGPGSFRSISALRPGDNSPPSTTSGVRAFCRYLITLRGSET